MKNRNKQDRIQFTHQLSKFLYSTTTAREADTLLLMRNLIPSDSIFLVGSLKVFAILNFETLCR